MRTKIYLFILLAILIAAGLKAQNKTGTLQVIITDKKHPEEFVPFANVVLYSGKTQVAVGITNVDGVAFIKGLAPGKYDLKAVFIGYETEESKNIEIAEGKTKITSLAMRERLITLNEVIIVAHEEPLIDVSTTCCCTVDREHWCSGCCCRCSYCSAYRVIEKETEPKSLNYFPNPTNGTITLQANDEIEELSLVDESGRLREQYTINKNDRVEKDLSNYTNGLYILQYQSKGKLYREKILVIH